MLDPILHSLYGCNLLNTHTSLEGTYYYSSLFTDEKLGHREIGETLIQSKSQKSAFSTTTLFCLLEMGRLVKPEMGKIFLGREGCYLASRLMR